MEGFKNFSMSILLTVIHPFPHSKKILFLTPFFITYLQLPYLHPFPNKKGALHRSLIHGKLPFFSYLILFSAVSPAVAISRQQPAGSAVTIASYDHFLLIYPFAFSVSAHSTAPPAAPLTVLWESPMNLKS